MDRNVETAILAQLPEVIWLTHAVYRSGREFVPEVARKHTARFVVQCADFGQWRSFVARTRRDWFVVVLEKREVIECESEDQAMMLFRMLTPIA